MAQPIVILHPSPESVAKDAAEHFVKLAHEAIAARGRFVVALSGGSTPKAMYAHLVEPQFRDAVEWDKVHLFWGDERFVPYDSSDSTYGVAKAVFIDEVSIPAENVHPMPVTGSLEDAAQTYSREIKDFFGDAEPKFDVVFLGMGPDGHTASLFPGHAYTEGTDVITIERNAPKLPPERLSFTLDLINNAYVKIFLVTGEDKADTVHRVLTQPDFDVPAAQIKNNVIWLLDDAAGSELKLAH